MADSWRNYSMTGILHARVQEHFFLRLLSQRAAREHHNTKLRIILSSLQKMDNYFADTPMSELHVHRHLGTSSLRRYPLKVLYSFSS